MRRLRPGSSLGERLLARALAPQTERVLAPVEAFAPRGCAARPRLEGIVRSVLEGCSAALCERRPAELAAALHSIPAELRGFAFEGAGLGLALVDAFLPRRRGRLLELARGAGAPHAYLILVGAGLAAASLPRPFARRVLGALDAEPTLRWLAFDGLGFHAGTETGRFPPVHRRKPSGLGTYERRAFDQGLGRSLWFVEARDRSRISCAIESFLPERRADLWSGVGLACAYAGGEGCELVRALLAASGEHRPHFAQGVAFAAAARVRAGNTGEATELACAIAWEASPAEVAGWAERAREQAEQQSSTRVALATCAELPTYELWRALLRARNRQMEERRAGRA